MGKIIITDDALKLAAASVREAMLSTIPPAEECRHTFSPEFEAKMEQLIAAEQRRSRRRSAARRVAAVFLAVLLGVGAWLAVDAPARASFFNWVREVYETYIVYRFTGEPSAEGLPEYRLGWLPDGYVEVSMVHDDNLQGYLYQNGETALTFMYYHLIQGDAGIHYNEDAECTPITVNGHQGHFYAAANATVSNDLIWVDEPRGILFVLSGFLSQDDMLNIAESLCLENMTK